MCKLPSVTGREVEEAFATFGFYVDRIQGSHHILKKDGYRFRLSVPVHGNRAVKTGTLRGLIRTAGISVSDFRNALG